MAGYELAFSITENSKILIKFERPLLSISSGCDYPILLSHDQKLILLAKFSTYFNIKNFRDIIQKVLDQELYLHSSIVLDIGYLYNGYNYNDKGFIKEDAGCSYKVWVGNRYRLWYAYQNEKKYITWIYNNKEGDIIFKVTPYYPYFHCNIKEQRYFMPFKKWILEYKPYFISTISRTKAQGWLDQANDFLQAVENNVARFEENKRQGRTFNDPY